MRRPAIPAIVIVVAAIAALYGWTVVALTPALPGAIGLNLNALGTDWMVFYSGARYFFDGQLAHLYDGESFTAGLNAAFSGWLSMPTPFRPWVYPPTYLLALLPFGALPYFGAYLLFQAVTAALLIAALWDREAGPARRGLVIAAALLGPAAAINFGMGQNALLMAALIVGGLRLLPLSPAAAGAILGLLTMKPQFWLLVPVALIAAREWRALLWSLASAAALALLSVAVFGIECWFDWLRLARASYADPHGQWVELGRMWGDSIYACAVSGGLPTAAAVLLQAAGIIVAAAAVYATFRLPLPRDCKIAAMLACTILAAPHSSLADTALLATAAALWAGGAPDRTAKDGILARWTLALAIWLAPLFNPPLVSPVGRLTPLLILGFALMTISPALRFTVPRRAGLRPPAALLAKRD